MEKTPRNKNLGYTMLTEGWLFLLLTVYPLYLTADKYRNLTLHKTTFVYFTTCVLLLAVGALGLWQVMGRTWTKSRTRGENLTARKETWGKRTLRFLSAVRGYEWALAAYVLGAIFSTLLSSYPETAFWGYRERYDGLLTLLVYCAIFGVVSRLAQPRERDWLGWASGVILVTLIAILQFYGLDIFRLFPYESYINGQGQPALNGATIFFRTTLGNVDVVSTYACLGFLFCSLRFIRREDQERLAGGFEKGSPSKGWRGMFYWLAAVMSFILLLLAGADSGLVGAGMGLMLMLPILFVDRRALARFWYLLTGVAWAALLWIGSNPWTERTGLGLAGVLWGGVTLVATGGSLVSIFVGKRTQWRRGWSLNLGRRLGIGLLILSLGVGFCGVEVAGRDPARGVIYEAREILHGNWDDDFGSHRIFIWRYSLKVAPEHLWLGTGPDTFYEAFGPYQSESKRRYGRVYDKAHNEYLQILICNGLWGLAAYLTFVGLLLRHAVRRARQDATQAAALAAVTGYLIQAFFNFSVPITAPFFWIFLGILARQSPDRSGSY